MNTATLSKPKVSSQTQLCVVIVGPTLSQARDQVQKANSRAQLLEFRIDQFVFTQVEAIKLLLEAAALPVIITIRKRSQGGEFSFGEQQRLDKFREIALFEPAYIDLEYDIEPSFFREIQKISPNTKLICSYHDFEHTPKDLQTVLEVMKSCPANIYKLVSTANSVLDAMHMLYFTRENARKGLNIAGICMGETGIATRILAPIYGSALVFATLSDEFKTAPGQLTADELKKRYHYLKLSKETHVYGLIGDPIINSPSHNTHNKVIRDFKQDAVYMKFRVKEQELPEFLEMAKVLGISGLSVTMPLKEAVISKLSASNLDVERIGAINTLKFQGRKIAGFNTDGIGALNAIERIEPVKGKRVVILGAGGTTKAITYEAIKRGANVVVLNRTLDKAEAIAKKFGTEFGSLEDFPQYSQEGYDILINCTSVGMFSKKEKSIINKEDLLPGKIVMDVIASSELTNFLQDALDKKCTIIEGYEMLRFQAIEQFRIWFGDELNAEELEASFSTAFESFKP